MKRKMKRVAWGCLAFVIGIPVALFAFVYVMSLLNGQTDSPTDFSKSVVFADPPPLLTEPITLKLVTYNIANAYLFAVNRPERIKGLVDKLKELDPDIAGIQESFIEKDRTALIEGLKDSRLKYHAAFPSGTVGSGLLILSAFPIQEHWFHRYEKSNPWYKLWEGDWWAGKGVGMVRAELPGGALVDFYDTHAQAGRGHPTRYLEVRSSQMKGLADFVQATQSATGLAFVVGDFNTKLDAADIKIAIEQLGLLRLMNLDSRIDHIFGVSNLEYQFETLETVEISGEVMGSGPELFLSRAPTLKEIYHQFTGDAEMTALSDHSGYMSTIRITPMKSSVPPTEN